MNNRIKLVAIPLAVVAAAALGTIGARTFADEGPDGHGPRWARFAHSYLQEMDTNKDGTVSAQEIDAFEKTRAAGIDTDKDGAVSVEELKAWRENQAMQRMADELKRMDRDGDGKVSIAEFEAAGEWRLARLDRDGDGSIEPSEMEGGRWWMHRQQQH